MPLPGTNYVVLLYGAPQHMPQAICGKSKKTYGFALWDTRRAAHVLRIPATVWDPDPVDRRRLGGGKDIMENTRRRAVMNVICEPGIDPRGADVTLAEECDRIQARVAELERDLALLLPAQQAAGDFLALFAPPVETVYTQVPAVTVATSLEKRLEAIPFRALREIAKRINDEGMAALKLQALNSHTKLVAALAGVEQVEKYLPEPEAIAA